MDLSKDVLAFARERRRMCDFYSNRCKDCALFKYDCELSGGDEEADKRILEYVQAWSDAHPQKTYLQDFIEKFPNCVKDEKGCPVSCRKFIYPLMSRGNCAGWNCSECWNEVMEDKR